MEPDWVVVRNGLNNVIGESSRGDDGPSEVRIIFCEIRRTK